jgi:hypothetical protein
MTAVPTRDYEPTKMYLAVLTEEYKTLRDESKQASINMLFVMQIGGAVSAAIIAAAGAAWQTHNGLAPFLFFIVLPIVAAMSMLIWMGEARRFKRVGDYLCMLEWKFYLIVDDIGFPSVLHQVWDAQQRDLEEALGFVPSERTLLGPLAWEQWLRFARPLKFPEVIRTSGHDLLLYIVRAAFFPALMLLSIVLGILQMSAVSFHSTTWEYVRMFGWAILGASVLLAIAIAAPVFKPMNMSKWPKPPKTSNRRVANGDTPVTTPHPKA